MEGPSEVGRGVGASESCVLARRHRSRRLEMREPSLLSSGLEGMRLFCSASNAALAISASMVITVKGMMTLLPALTGLLARSCAIRDRLRLVLELMRVRLMAMQASSRKGVLLMLVGLALQFLAIRSLKDVLAERLSLSNVRLGSVQLGRMPSPSATDDESSDAVNEDDADSVSVEGSCGMCDYELDIGEELAAFWAMPPESVSRARRLALTESEVKNNDLKFDFEASAYATWRTRVTSFLRMRHPQAAELFALGYDEATERILAFPAAREANIWLALMLRAVLPTSGSKGKIFDDKLMEAESAEEGLSCSGVDVADRLATSILKRDSNDEAAEWTDYERTTYFKLGATDDEQRLAVRLIVKKMRVVSKVHRDAPFALLRAVIHKIPSSPKALADQKAKYVRAVTYAERNEIQPQYEGRPLTVESMTEWLVLDLQEHATPAQVELSAVEKRVRDRQRLKDDKGPCTSCKAAHHWSACSIAPCKDCKNKWCQGARGLICFGLIDAVPVYKDALGGALPGKLQGHMNKMRKEAGKVVSEVSVLEFDFESLPPDACDVAAFDVLDLHVDDDDMLPGLVGGNAFSLLEPEVLMIERSESMPNLRDARRGDGLISMDILKGHGWLARRRSFPLQMIYGVGAGYEDIADGVVDAVHLGVDSVVVSGIEFDHLQMEMAIAEAAADGQTVRVQSDSGANVLMLKTGSPLAVRAAVQTTAVSHVHLASDIDMRIDGVLLLAVDVPDESLPIQCHQSTSLRRDVLGVCPFWREAGVAVLTHPFNLVVHAKSMRVNPLYVQNDLYFIDFVLVSTGVRLQLQECPLPMTYEALMVMLTASAPEQSVIETVGAIAGAERGVYQRAQLWAVRFGTHSAGLKLILPASRGIDLAKLSPAVAAFIDSDAIRRGAALRNRPVRKAVAPADAPAVPGTHWELDGYGHVMAPSVEKLNTYQWIIMDAVSDFGYAQSVQSSNQESVLEFLDAWFAEESSKYGHTPCVLSVDAVPNLNTADFRAECHRRYGVFVPPAAGDDHEQIPHCEAAQDPLTRQAEADIKRAERSRSFFLLARAYAMVRRNARVKSGESKSRIHVHTGRPSDFSTHPFYVFGVRVNILIQREKRDGLGAQRYDEGVLVGVSSNMKYMVYKPSTGVIVLRRDVDPIGEMQLALRGIPAGSTVADAGAQTECADFEELERVQPRAPLPPPVRVVAGYAPIPDDTRLELAFKGDDGVAIFYPGRVVKSFPQESGKVLTEIAWDDLTWKDDPLWKGRVFDLTSQHHPWRLLHDAVPMPVPVDPAVPLRRSARLATDAQVSVAQLVPLPEVVMRPSCKPSNASVRLASETGASAAFALAVDMYSEREHVKLFEDTVYQHYGETVKVACASLLELDHARVALLAFEASLIEASLTVAEMSSIEIVAAACESVVPMSSARLEVSKVTASNDVLVKSDTGDTYTIHIPRNQKELDDSPWKTEWDVARRKAHLAMINDPRNSLVKVRDVKSKGAVVAPCVIEDSVKVFADTGKLEKFKSRFCYDQARVNRILVRIGKEEYHLLYCTDTDDVTLKLFISDACLGCEDVTFADLSNAYWHADRYYSAFCYMATYENMFDEDGDLLCYQSGAPLNGERTAGSDYHIWRDEIFESAGAHQSITCLGTFHITGEDGCRASVVTCVDDFLLKETRGNDKTLTMRILKAFADRMGGWEHVKYHDRPTAYKGYGIAWSRDGSVATLHMTPQIEAMAYKYIPEAFDNVMPPGVLTGTKLCNVADSLCMPVPRPLVMSAKAKETQEIIGKGKFIERGVMPRVSRHFHALACVMASPPEQAHVVARSVAYIMYLNRYDGITFGGAGLSARVLLQGGLYCDVKPAEGAPLELEAMADTTTGARPIYAYAVTYNGGVVAHGVKKIAGLVPSSCLSECKGSTYASEWIEVARNALKVFGRPPQTPSVVGTDNAANLAIAMRSATPARSKPDLAKWASLHDRIDRKLMTMSKVDTTVMPVDFMTKWLKRERMLEQLAYIINSRHTVWPG